MLLLLLQAALQSPLAARADTLQPVHDALHYDITLAPSDTSAHLLGEVETIWRLRSSDPVEVQLDSAMRVVRVMVDGRPNTRIARTMYARSSVDVTIPHQKRAGDSITTRVRYHGVPRDGLIVSRNPYGERTIFGDNWPDRAHYWLAVQDHPSDKATVAFHVQARVGQRVIANGVLQKVDTLAHGKAVWHYRLDEPIPVYTMVIGIGALSRSALPQAACEIRCVPVAVWTYPQDSAYALSGPFRRAGDMLAYFSRLIGPFPYPSLAHVESTTRFGGMENSTAIFYDDKLYAKRTLDESLVAHETAHQWFGDAVTEADWHHLWLSEGFATYLSALWVRYAEGDSAFAATMRKAAETVFTSPVSERPIIDTAAHDLMGLLNSNNYPKGAWVLHQLRGLIGDSAFVAGLRRYYQVFQDSTALSADFAAIMSAAAGQDLTWYFRQALTQPGYPILEVQRARRGGRSALILRQTQKSQWGVYRMPGLQVRVDGKSYRVDMAAREAVLTLGGGSARAERVEVDPGGWWLVKAEKREK